MRTTWTVISGMRRSGTALRYEIAKEILGPEFALGWVTWQEFDDLAEKYDGTQPHALVKSHVDLTTHSSSAWRINYDGRMRIIHSHRDIRDVAASIIKFIPGWDDEALEKAVVATMNEFDSWEWNVQCKYVSSYERMMSNPSEEIEGIARFLGFWGDCSGMADKFSIDSNRARLPSEGKSADRVWWHNHINDGKVGKWRDELTPGQAQMINQISAKWREGMGYLDE